MLSSSQEGTPPVMLPVMKWLETMITSQNITQTNSNFEVKVKLGKFTGKTFTATKKLQLLKTKFTQLDKSQIAYEFQSTLSLDQFDQAKQHLMSLKHAIMLRIDINFSNKDQRASIIYDARLDLNKEDQSKDQDQKNRIKIYRGHGILVEKQRQQTNQLDIIDDSQHYRISLSTEKVISKSLKDILKQFTSRKDRISLIRIKQSNIYEDQMFEHNLSTVFQVFKTDKENFDSVISLIQETKYYNAHEGIQLLLENANKLNLPPLYESEIEVKCQTIKDADIKDVVEKLIHTSESLSQKIEVPSSSDKQELGDEKQKKIKIN